MQSRGVVVTINLLGRPLFLMFISPDFNDPFVCFRFSVAFQFFIHSVMNLNVVGNILYILYLLGSLLSVCVEHYQTTFCNRSMLLISFFSLFSPFLIKFYRELIGPCTRNFLVYIPVLLGVKYFFS